MDKPAKSRVDEKPEGVERRKHPRFSVDFTAHVTGSFGSFEGRVCDICRDAVWIEGEKSVDTGTDVALVLDFPGGGSPAEIGGRVIRSGSGQRYKHGMAVMFTVVAPTVATLIDFFIEEQANQG